MKNPDTITLTHDEAELLLNCLSAYANEIYYQLNDSPFEHDPAGIMAWEADEARCDQATGILAAKLYPMTGGTDGQSISNNG